MSWIISSKKMKIPESVYFLGYNVYSDKVVKIGNNSAFLEGGFYYHEQLFGGSISQTLDQIEGSFAIALFNGDCVLCANDCACTRNIYYYRNSNFWVVSSSLEKIIDCLAINNCLKLDTDYLATYLYFGTSHDMTPYKDVRKLLSGCVIKLTNDLEILPHIDFDSILYKAEATVLGKDSAKYCLSVLQKSCIEIVQQYKPQKSVVEISGGIDSSILAGLFCTATDLSEGSITGYSYNYKNQSIGNEIKFMCAVAQKNKITNHIITNLSYDSIRLEDKIYVGCPDIAMLNKGLFEKTKSVYTNTDIIISGQGGDGCIGDEYNVFVKNGNPVMKCYFDSLYEEKFILSTLISKVFFPKIFDNIVPWLTFSNTPIKPVWSQRKIEQVANKSVNKTYKRLGKYTCNAAWKKIIIDYMTFNGLQSDDYYKCVCLYPYLTRDMIVLGRIFNDSYCDKRDYRARIKKVIGEYVPHSILNRKGKSRMDNVYTSAIALNMNIYQKIIEQTKLFSYFPIDRSLIIEELKRIVTGESCDLTYSVRLLSLIVWFDQLCNVYPTIEII